MPILITSKLGNLETLHVSVPVDYIDLEWYESKKRILNKLTRGGLEITLKFLSESHQLLQNDILIQNSEYVIAVNILDCEVLVISPRNMAEMASICYEIGNKHLQLFYEDDKLLISFENPIYTWLKKNDFVVHLENRKLNIPLKTSVLAHDITISKNLLFQSTQFPAPIK